MTEYLVHTLKFTTGKPTNISQALLVPSEHTTFPREPYAVFVLLFSTFGGKESVRFGYGDNSNSMPTVILYSPFALTTGPFSGTALPALDNDSRIGRSLLIAAAADVLVFSSAQLLDVDLMGAALVSLASIWLLFSGAAGFCAGNSSVWNAFGVTSLWGATAELNADSAFPLSSLEDAACDDELMLVISLSKTELLPRENWSS